MEQRNKSKKEGMIIGVHPVLEALEAGVSLDKVFIQQSLRNDPLNELVKSLKEHGYFFMSVPAQKLDRLTKKNHQGVVAFQSAVDFSPLEELVIKAYESGSIPALIVLDRITDVRNLGAIARTAECLGCQGIVVPSAHTAQIGEDAMKTSAGALNHLSVSKVSSLPEACQYLKDSGFQLVGCSEKSGLKLEDADLTGPVAIVMGAEDEGISKALLLKCDKLVGIPMLGKLGSLNVSVAAGMLLYEMARQRGFEN